MGLLLVFRFRRTPRKSTDAKFAFMMTLSPQFLNAFIIYLLFHSISGPGIFLKIPRPSSRYRPRNTA